MWGTTGTTSSCTLITYLPPCSWRGFRASPRRPMEYCTDFLVIRVYAVLTCFCSIFCWSECDQGSGSYLDVMYIKYLTYTESLARGVTTKSFMVKVQWIPYIAVEHFRTCTVGRISLNNWHNVRFINSDIYNPYISMQELSSCRYAISFQPIKPGDIYVDMAFISLDGDCLDASAGFCHDFGDDQIGHFLNNKSFISTTTEDFLSVHDYMPSLVMKYLNIT